MHPPALQLVSSTHFCKGGDVEIDPGAAIAPGVVIRAEPGSRIIISAGVCIGAGSIIRAYRGNLLLEVGVSLGAGALILGFGRIGANTCVGAAATLINPAIAANQAIAPNSLMGDLSRRLPNSQTDSQTDSQTSVAATIESPASQPEATTQAITANPSPEQPQPKQQPAVDQNGASAAPVPGQPANLSQVYGRRQIDQLLITLFPHRQPLNSPLPPDSS